MAKSIGLNHTKYSNTVQMSVMPPWMFIMPIIDLNFIEEVKKQNYDPIKM